MPRFQPACGPLETGLGQETADFENHPKPARERKRDTMKLANGTAILLSMLTTAGCMRSQRQADLPQGGTAGIVNSTRAQATAPPEADQALNRVERADKLIGEEVLTSDHLKTGKIDNFVIDQDSGQILYAIVGIGGVLGVGETRVAVPPTLFIEAKKGNVELNVDKHKLTRAPQVDRAVDKAPQADFLNRVYGYYGQPATWNQTSAAPSAAFNSARTATQVTGMTVQNSAHLDIGKVETVVLNVPAGRELYVVVAPSSDMNLGNNYYALPPKALKLSTDQKTLVTDLSRDKLANAPHFTKDDWSELSNTAWAQRVYQYYGQPASFSNGPLQPTGRSIRNK
jgi:sporulation protein YlmC with PRC-barrel domain